MPHVLVSIIAFQNVEDRVRGAKILMPFNDQKA
jgi:hypothetical protein